MPKKKIHFALQDITIIRDDVNAELLSRIKSDSMLRPSSTLEVGFEFDFNNSLIKINCGSVLYLEDEIVYSIKIDNHFYVRDIKEVAESTEENGEVNIKDTPFFHFLVDTAISHLRGIQSIKLRGRLEKIKYAPFIKAKVILQPQNKIDS